VILAGAGTGKTTTITHRIAYQVATGAFAANRLLAVTFTQKAAGELQQRLAALGISGGDRVEARTFHSAALSQLSAMWARHTGEALPAILYHKAPVISSLANALPPPHKFLPRRELAGEIEWAKNRRIPPEGYLDALVAEDHEPPIPADLMDRVYTGYERRKRSMGKLDFEDMLGLALRLFEEHPAAAEEIRARYDAFTVDEYQDVNPLQATLLECWLGGRDELCVVGDDYQTIYAFTGASPSHLLDFPQRFPGATIVKLEDNYRSTPQVLALANRLAPRLGGFAKTLRATRPDGPAVVHRSFGSNDDEVAWVVREARRLHDEADVAWEQIAILSRINARSEPYEEAFAAAHIPYQVRDGAFLRRPAPRGVLARLRREPDAPGEVTEAVVRVTDTMGFSEDAEPGSDEEVTMQADLARMRSLAAEYARAAGEAATVPGFLAELARRFAVEESGRGVQLMTYHRAKGLEFDAVFLPRLMDGELPFRSGRSVADVDEERRLLYVGITRARRWLVVSHTTERRAVPSPFLSEILPETTTRGSVNDGTRAARPKGPAIEAPADGPLLERLKTWRKQRAQADGVPAYVVFHDRTLAAIAEVRPQDQRALFAIKGVGPAKIDRYGEEILAITGGE
jgi:DNA helicase-2/ATP-dependent DNA helicase PcrA